ncbi:citramalyl-CoA lyase, mitochondrial-like isoform X2 [Watersipora subatra]
MAKKDIACILGGKSPPSAMVVPKVDTLDEAKWLADELKRYEGARGMQLITQVESAQGLLNLNIICNFLSEKLEDINANLAAVIFGSDDFCASIGATRSASGEELLYARQKVVTVAKAYKAQAIDMVHIDFKDMQGFIKYSMQGAAMGFTGKQVIHPSQVAPAHQAFAPSEQRVSWATELIEAFNKHQQEGKGAFVFQGQMIDKPSLLQAQNIKSIADAIVRREL